MRRAALSLIACLLVATPTNAADHLDAPAAIGDPSADISDLYTWMSPDAAQLNLVMNIAAPKFSDAIQYVFHVASMQAYGESAMNTDIICTFDPQQRVTCWAEDDVVTGDARTALGITSASGKLRVFAGARSDPFFFNAMGFAATIGAVKNASPSLTFDQAGCPAVDMNTSAVLVNQLKSAPGGGAPRNFFAANVVSSLVLVVDKSIVTRGGPILAVWASTRR